MDALHDGGQALACQPCAVGQFAQQVIADTGVNRIGMMFCLGLCDLEGILMSDLGFGKGVELFSCPNHILQWCHPQ